MDKRSFLRNAGRAGAGALAMRVSGRAFAAVFLEPAQARAQLWPAAASFASEAVALDEPTLAKVASLSGTRVPKGFAPRIERALAADGRLLGWVLFDQVIGKYEQIDYATAIDAAGVIGGVEILVYRESHGAEIRTPAWRKQFVGRRAPAQTAFEDDIRNITGATMSCRHVTEGVRRLGALHQLVLAPAAQGAR